jgi:hypothetical protein
MPAIFVKSILSYPYAGGRLAMISLLEIAL